LHLCKYGINALKPPSNPCSLSDCQHIVVPHGKFVHHINNVRLVYFFTGKILNIIWLPIWRKFPPWSEKYYGFGCPLWLLCTKCSFQQCHPTPPRYHNIAFLIKSS